MNQLSREKRIEIVKCLVEGMSLRATSRITDVSRTTVQKLLLEIGEVCTAYHDEHVRNLDKTYKVQCDEIWSFVGKKDKNMSANDIGTGVGSVWTWTALDAQNKLIISYAVGERTLSCAMDFMKDLKSRLSKRIQLSTDGFSAYRTAVEIAFQGEVEFAQVIKLYADLNSNKGEQRYSPAECTSIRKEVITGRPVKEDISTSYVERQNLSMRMGMRRFTRLTNAFSKKMEYHVAGIALYFMHYNFVRIHQTLRCTPAMEAGIEKKLWDIGDIVDLLK